MKTEIKRIELVKLSGYGQYAIKVEIEVNGELYKKSFHTTDSELWDERKEEGSMDEWEERLLNKIGGIERVLESIDYSL